MPCGTYCCDVYGLCYIASYPDLILARGIDAAGGQCHFTTGPFGRGKPCGFDVVCDLSRYPHLHAAFGSGAWAATVHHIRYGYSEVRLSIGLPSGLRRADVPLGHDEHRLSPHLVCQGGGARRS